jgi:hypothetical protein
MRIKGHSRLIHQKLYKCRVKPAPGTVAFLHTIWEKRERGQMDFFSFFPFQKMLLKG